MQHGLGCGHVLKLQWSRQLWNSRGEQLLVDPVLQYQHQSVHEQDQQHYHRLQQGYSMFDGHVLQHLCECYAGQQQLR
jgi:hypothetical protein